MKEFRFVGSHPDELDGGRPIEPGEFTGPIDTDLPKNKQLLEDELLLDVPNGTYKKEYDSAPPEAPVLLKGAALNKRAEELGIEGRSEMPADELRAAVAEAEANNDSGDGD